jgi:hypothetical protein
MNDTEKALNYYRAIVERVRPDYVPSRVFLSARVSGDGIFRSTFAEAGEHDCQSSQWGTISIVATNGEDLGVKPGEFQVVEWRLNHSAGASAPSPVSAPGQSLEAGEKSPMDGLIPSTYRLPWSRFQNATPWMAAELVATHWDKNRPTRWAIRESGSVLAKDGEWEFEPNPSSRTPEFLERTRWGSLEEAATFAAQHPGTPTLQPSTENE